MSDWNIRMGFKGLDDFVIVEVTRNSSGSWDLGCTWTSNIMGTTVERVSQIIGVVGGGHEGVRDLLIRATEARIPIEGTYLNMKIKFMPLPAFDEPLIQYIEINGLRHTSFEFLNNF